jgi:aminoglycoside/choline kinase family phosphotransferase
MLILNNIKASKILVHNSKLGITIQEDLGDNDLLEVVNYSNRLDMTFRSLEMLVKIQELNDLKIHRLKYEDLKNQIALFSDIFLKQFLQIEPDNSILDLSNVVLEHVQEQPWLNCHFDYERRNLIASMDNDVHVIDFQDLCVGPIGIDLAGILLDHYEPYDEVFVKECLTFYQSKSILSINNAELFESFRWGGIQRNMRILGTLSRLYIDQDRSFRLTDLPMILENLISIIPNNWNCRNYMINVIKPSLEKRLASI